MDFFAVLQIILRSLSITAGALIVILYLLAQMFQTQPRGKFSLKMYDWIALASCMLLLALGFNSYWGALAFLPLLAWKFAARALFATSRLKGKGAWMELRWNKFPPKGFQHLPRETRAQLEQEVARLPKDTHFVIPRFFALIAVRYLMKKTKADAAKANMPQLKGREKETIGKLEEMAKSVTTLEPAKTKTFNLPFGVLHISRL